jgi:hypothetical protein
VSEAEPRAALAQISSLLTAHFGADLRGLYLFGSLAVGAFVPERSDLDLLAVLGSDVRESELPALEALHTGFVADHPEWSERIEVGYISHEVLQTLGDIPTGRIAVISPGEPLNLKDAGADWVLNWYGVCANGEVIEGPPPRELGPEVTPEAFKRAVETQLEEWKEEIRAPWRAYVPAAQGYAVVTTCRAMYALAMGEQTTKERAVAWVAEQSPEWADFVNEALRQHRADVSGAHVESIRFVEFAIESATGEHP